ncbi:GNAT family N-acetyltransferase [Paracoccaceae bacterium]|nr:GNAT family N-acetyltransferase [Paracoccaceae bacterium]
MNFRDLSIETHRFLLRTLKETDASQEYLSWMNDDKVSKYISAAAETKSIEKLKEYIHEKTTKKDCIFLGVFEKITNKHIGNIKYEPICFTSKEAVMGVLLGDREWRGKNVFKEIFLASQKCLSEFYSIETIRLGVDISNFPAIRAYEKVGFCQDALKMDTKLEHIQMVAKYNEKNRI